jgi:hypothetical protein
MSQLTDKNIHMFATEWFALAKTIVERIGQDPEIIAMRKDYQEKGQLTLDQRGQFIAVANRIKGEVMHGEYGPDGSDTYKQFTERWRHWYDNKGVVSNSQVGRRLTNEEHIVYSSTPDAEEFFRNMET